MSIKKSPTRYGALSQFFHWFVALLVIVMLSLSFFMGDVPKAYKPTVYFLHKSTGLLVLAMMVLRVIWSLCCRMPALPQSVPTWQAVLARLGHYCLYLFLFIMPLSGLIMSVASNRLPSFYGLFTVTIPGIPESKPLASFMNSTHEVIAWVLIVLILLHLSAVFVHTVIEKNNLIKRMLPKRFN